MSSSTVLNKNSGIPLHVQLTNLLREQIQLGVLKADTQLPSERELCEQHDISRITARAALSELSRQGLIYTVAGKGSFVAPSQLDEELQPLNSFTADMARRGLTAASRILEARVVNADDEQAGRLDLPVGAEVVVLKRIRLIQEDGTPIAIQSSLLPHHLCPRLLDYDLKNRSLFEILRHEYHLKLTSADTRIAAGLADDDVTRLLDLPRPAAVLVSTQTTYTADGSIVEHTHSVFRADRYTLSYRANPQGHPKG